MITSSEDFILRMQRNQANSWLRGSRLTDVFESVYYATLTSAHQYSADYIEAFEIIESRMSGKAYEMKIETWDLREPESLQNRESK